MQNSRLSISAMLAIALSFLFGFLHHYQVFENDVFFHARIGEEIVRTARSVRSDFWTYTSPGHAWVNHEWLATVLTYMASALAPHYALLPTLRFLLAMATFGVLSGVIRSVCTTERSRSIATVLLLPGFYIGVFLQMRPEIYATLLFSILVWVWTSHRKIQSAVGWSIGILLLWTNLHSGTVPFGILFVWMAVFASEMPRRSKAGLLAVIPLLWLASPIGIDGPLKAFDFFGVHPGTADHPDLRPFSFKLLAYRSFGVSAWLWGVWIVLGMSVYRHALVGHRSLQATPYGKPKWFWTVCAGLTLMGFLRIRAFPYVLILLLPVLAVAIDRWVSTVLADARRERLFRILVAGAMLVLATGVVQHFDRYTPPLGFGVQESKFPVGGVRFIAENRPQTQLLHETNAGGYLMDRLREYPVFDATSGEQSEPFTAEKQAAGRSAEAMSTLARKYGINTVMLGEWSPSVNEKNPAKLSSFETLFPLKEWALVYFDNSSTVLISRIPAHRELLARFEYRYLLRYLAGAGAALQKSDPAFAQSFRAELARCLETTPDDHYCQAGMASYDVSPVAN